MGGPCISPAQPVGVVAAPPCDSRSAAASSSARSAGLGGPGTTAVTSACSSKVVYGGRETARDAAVTSLSEQSGTIELAGKKVVRLGFGSMRFTGRGIWGEPSDRAECVAVLRRAVELGVQLLDTAAGSKRLGPAAWPPVGRPEYLRQQALLSMRRLGVDQIDLFQLHRIDPLVPVADQVGKLANLREEGKIVSVGLPQVAVDQLEQARSIAEIAVCKAATTSVTVTPRTSSTSAAATRSTSSRGHLWRRVGWTRTAGCSLTSPGPTTSRWGQSPSPGCLPSPR